MKTIEIEELEGDDRDGLKMIIGGLIGLMMFVAGLVIGTLLK